MGDGEQPHPVEQVLPLEGDIEHDDHDDDKHYGPAGGRRADEGAKGQYPRRAGGRKRPTAVVQPTGVPDGERTSKAGQPEQPDHLYRVPERRAAEQKRQRRPEQRECGEPDGGQDQRPSSRPLAFDHRADRGDQRRVRHTRPRCQRWDRPVEQDREQDGDDRGEGEDRTPPGGAGDEPADRAGGQDNGEGPRRDGADDPSAVGLAGKVSGERCEDLPGNRRHAEHAQCEEEYADRRRQRAQQQCGGRGQQHHRDEPAAVQDVAERHEQQHADGVPDLRRGDEPAGRRGRGA
jgi:hypothetical protein